MYFSLSKLKRARPATARQSSSEYGRRHESEADSPVGKDCVFEDSLGRYNKCKKIVKEPRIRDSCSDSKNNNFGFERRVFSGEKRSLPENVRPCVNWSDEGSITSKEKVKEVLKLFNESLNRFKNEARLTRRCSNTGNRLHKKAAMALGKHKWMNTTRRIGSVPGIEIGDRFQCRAQLCVIGLHRQFEKGIDYMEKDGILLATSVVATDKYSNEMKSSGVLIYCGEGGNPRVLNGKPPKDQVPKRGNLALMNSKERNTPVRVILTNITTSGGTTYVYDGLYLVEKVMQKRGEFGKLVFQFELRRVRNQREVARTFLLRSEKRNSSIPIVDDISKGKEKMPIPVVNRVDDETPSQFTYIAHIVEKNQSILSGCSCTDRCSSSEDCPCKAKSGREFPYDDCKHPVRKKPCIYECGDSCNCPDSCNNRVSQFGIQLQLEVFKTESKGFGVRSRSYVPAGSFVCEYVGKIVQTKETYQRFGRDEYLFDIGDNYDDRISGSNRRHLFCNSEFSKKAMAFTIDAGPCGNVGRFINHSCSPNLYVQNVLYDHNDCKRPHVMLFAREDIAPGIELTYDYKCRIGELRYMNGRIKAKKCMCKSYDCLGKFY